MKSFRSSLFLVAVAAVALCATFMADTAQSKSLYVITNINQSPTPISAYDVQPDGTLVYQTTTTIPYHGWGAVDLTIDTVSEFLFVTYEQSNIIQLIDGKTMTDEGTVQAPGATNLAGIVIDQGKNLVYTMDRYTNHLYVYTWDSSSKTLTLQTDLYLSGITGAFGITLDEVNGWLFVADGFSTTVRYFNTSDWSEAGAFTVSHSPIGIAVDVAMGYVYTGGTFYGSRLLSRWDLNSSVETVLDLSTLGYSDGVQGVTIDPDISGSPIYVTTGFGNDRLLVIDSDMSTLIGDYGDVGDPTGLTIKKVGYNPLNLDKDDGLDYPTQGVLPGGQVTYDITYDNTANSFDVTNVEIVDSLPMEMNFVSASGTGTYDPVTHTVTWSIPMIPAGGTGTPEELIVQVDPTTPTGTTLTNYASITSTETGITTINHQTMVMSSGALDFLIYTHHSFELEGGTFIGNVGAREDPSGGWLFQYFEAAVGYNVAVHGDVYGDSVKVGDYGHVYGDVYCNDVRLYQHAIVDGDVNTPLSLPVEDPSPGFPSFSPGTTDVTVNPGDTVFLPPGDYGTVELLDCIGMPSAILVLEGNGNYNLSELIVGYNARVECQAACEIRIKGSLFLDALAALVPETGSGLTAGDIDIFVEGSDFKRNLSFSRVRIPEIGSGLSAPSQPAVLLSQVSETRAHIYAPNGTIKMGGNSATATGVFIAKWVKVICHTTVVTYEE